MPAGTFIIHDTTVRDVSSWLRFTIESQGWQINEQFRKRDEVVIKGVTRSKLGAWKWHRFVPFGKWMKRGQRVGIEVHVKPCAYGVLLGIAVVPYMELFDAKEIFLLTQGLADHCVDNKYSEETWEELIGAMKKRYKLTSRENARFMPSAYLKCSKCNWLNPLSANRCKNCGAKLRR